MRFDALIYLLKILLARAGFSRHFSGSSSSTYFGSAAALAPPRLVPRGQALHRRRLAIQLGPHDEVVEFSSRLGRVKSLVHSLLITLRIACKTVGNWNPCCSYKTCCYIMLLSPGNTRYLIGKFYDQIICNRSRNFIFDRHEHECGLFV